MDYCFTVAFALFITIFGRVLASGPCYNHQDETYNAHFKPSSCRSTCTVTPFFSPDNSVNAYVSVIQDAKENIDLLEPGKINKLYIILFIFSHIIIIYI